MSSNRNNTNYDVNNYQINSDIYVYNYNEDQTRVMTSDGEMSSKYSNSDGIQWKTSSTEDDNDNSDIANNQ